MPKYRVLVTCILISLFINSGIAFGAQHSLPEPAIHPVDTVFTYTTKVTLSKSCDDDCCDKAKIVYTVDGTDPRKSPAARGYEKPFKIDKSCTVKAFMKAEDTCKTSSDLIEKKYTKVESLPLPTVLPKEARVVFGEKISIHIKGFEKDKTVRIFYTLDGSDPSTAGIQYIEPFALHKSCILRAIAVSRTGKYLNSPIFYRKYTCYIALSPEPTFTPPSTNFDKKISVSLSVKDFEGDEDVTIYYTLDGRDPSIFNLIYQKPVTVTKITEIKAIAVRRGYRPSKVVSELYVNGPLPVVPRPQIDPEGGVYGGGVPSVTFKNVPDKSMVMYTLDGTEPDMASQLWEGKTIELQQPTTVKVKVFKNECVPSVTVTERYEYDELPEPIANHEHGTVFPDTLTVILRVPGFLNEMGLKIYYTLDGSDPRNMGQLFESSIVLNKSCILKTFARKRGYYDSQVNKYEYFNLVRVKHAYYQDNDKDGKIETAVICFDKRLIASPSIIEFSDPFSGKKRKVFDANITSSDKGRGKCLTISFIHPFGSGKPFMSGHYGRIPLPGEFDTAPFLIHDSTGFSKAASTIPEEEDAAKTQFDDGTIGIVNNPFEPGKTGLPEFIQQLSEFKITTGTAVVVKPQHPSDGYADIYDNLGNQVVFRKKLLEDPSTGNLYLIWNGKDRKKNIVEKGTYLIEIITKEKQSTETLKKKVKVTVKR